MSSNLKRTIKVLVFACLLVPVIPLLASSIHAPVPEPPSLFTLLFSHSDTPLGKFLITWESVFFSIAIGIILLTVFYFGSKQTSDLPKWLQNTLEFYVESFQQFAIEVIGPKGEKYAPFLGILFIYILAMNWLSVVPLAKPPSSNLSVTLALGLCVFAYVQYLSFRSFGFFGYLYHLAGSPKGVTGWLMVPLTFPIELITQLSRPLTLSFRLFGNVLGEDILIGTFALFGVTLLSTETFTVWLPLQLPFMLFSLLMGLMQAAVFTLLAAIYILLALTDEESHKEETSEGTAP